MNVLDAAFHTVHDYDGGAEALALRLCKSPNTLRHEVRPPRDSTAKLGLLTAIEIMEFSGDLRILNAMCARLNCTPPVPLPCVDDENGVTSRHVAVVAQEFSELMAEVARDACDGEITDNELARLERSFNEMVAAGQHMLGHFRQLNAAGKPAFPKVTG